MGAITQLMKTDTLSLLLYSRLVEQYFGEIQQIEMQTSPSKRKLLD